MDILQIAVNKNKDEKCLSKTKRIQMRSGLAENMQMSFVAGCDAVEFGGVWFRNGLTGRI